MNASIKAFIVDDSAIYRRILKDVLNSIEGVEVVGTAENGVMALEKQVTLSPDLVTLDMEMPGMNGLETLRKMSTISPEVFTVMVSGGDKHSADQTVEALGLGALDFIVKPEGGDFSKSKAELKENFVRIIRIVKKSKMAVSARNKVLRKDLTQGAASPPSKVAARPLSLPAVKDVCSDAVLPNFLEMLLVGSSTGGPKALEKFITRLPANINIPVLIVQHMPPLFTKSLAQKLNVLSSLDVREAVDGEKILPGRVYIAPGGAHMVVKKQEDGSAVIVINDDPPLNSCKPSVDKLFSSVADELKAKRTISVIMTGMGADGTEGVKKLREYGGGYCITQSEESCVVYGMPRAVVEAGYSSDVVSLDSIADKITEICMRKKAV